MRTSCEENPQLPFEDFEFDFFGGPRAALTTPPTCGTYTTTAELTPWSSPDGPNRPALTPSPSPRPGRRALRAHRGPAAARPELRGGRGRAARRRLLPLRLEVTRANGSQRLGALTPPCRQGSPPTSAGWRNAQRPRSPPLPRAPAGPRRTRAGFPSCPAASQSDGQRRCRLGLPIFVQGNVYLAGPYKGAPFSLAIITPAVAGPFDLGAVVVRQPSTSTPKPARAR